MLVSQILSTKPTTDVLTVTSGVSISDAAALLKQHRIGCLVVQDGGQGVAGILSERDIVRDLAATGGGCLDKTAGDLMTREVATATPDLRSDQVLATMTKGRFRHMPVLDGDRLVGLISIGDVVKARLEQLSMEKEALEGMIAGNW